MRNLRRITTLLAFALQHNCLRSGDLNSIRASEAVPAVARAFSKFMIAKTETVEPPWQVNETLNIFCHVLNRLGPQVTNTFFKDRIGWLDYTRLVLSTPAYYPAIYPLAFRTLSLAEGIGWITAWLQLGRQSATFALYRLLKPLFLLLISVLMAIGRWQPVFARVALHLLIWKESMEQVGRGQDEWQEQQMVHNHGMRRLLSSFWPHG